MRDFFDFVETSQDPDVHGTTSVVSALIRAWVIPTGVSFLSASRLDDFVLSAPIFRSAHSLMLRISAVKFCARCLSAKLHIHRLPTTLQVKNYR